MAHPTFSLPLGSTTTSHLPGFVERSIRRYASARSSRALAELLRYDSLLERMGRTLRRRAVPRHPTLSWLLGAQVALWQTADELVQHSDRTLADIHIPREA